MSKRQPSNIAASIRQRLLNVARERAEDFDFVLRQYGIERFLDRLSRSPHRDSLILKGATLFIVWQTNAYRRSMDADFLSLGSSEVGSVETLIKSISEIVGEDDGLLFDAATVRAEVIREDNVYDGIRVKMFAYLDTARIPIQLDVGFGDAVVPAAKKMRYPTILGQSIPEVLTYRPETVVAEKLEAVVKLGMVNTRMKDFYDLWILSSEFEFDGSLVADAIKATFERRGTDFPTNTPVALTDDFSKDEQKQNQWRVFLERVQASRRVELDVVVASLRVFLVPVVQALVDHTAFNSQWLREGPWRPDD
jgi:hypothetical protein